VSVEGGTVTGTVTTTEAAGEATVAVASVPATVAVEEVSARRGRDLPICNYYS
jgi:hypothetical protein